MYFVCSLVLAVSVLFAPTLAVAQIQPGSAGGTIGKTNKSLSGGEDTEPQRQPNPEAHIRHRATTEKSTVRRPSAGSGGNYDGVWNTVAIGQTCSDTYTFVITALSGRLTAPGCSGSVTSGGSVRGVCNGGDLTGVISGHVSGRSGSGRFKRSDGCVGSWTAVKQ